jgi:hypothetical protein
MLLDKLQEPHRSALARVRESVKPAWWRVALLGGAVRDLVTGRQLNDLDFVFEGVGDRDILHVWATLFGSPVTVTGFGGLRFEIDGVGVDVWRVEDNAIGAATGADAPTQERDLAHATTRAETGPWCGGKDRPRRRCGSTGLVAWRGHFGSAAGRLDQTPATCSRTARARNDHDGPDTGRAGTARTARLPQATATVARHASGPVSWAAPKPRRVDTTR